MKLTGLKMGLLALIAAMSYSNTSLACPPGACGESGEGNGGGGGSGGWAGSVGSFAGSSFSSFALEQVTQSMAITLPEIVVTGYAPSYYNQQALDAISMDNLMLGIQAGTQVFTGPLATANGMLGVIHDEHGATEVDEVVVVQSMHAADVAYFDNITALDVSLYTRRAEMGIVRMTWNTPLGPVLYRAADYTASSGQHVRVISAHYPYDPAYPEFPNGRYETQILNAETNTPIYIGTQNVWRTAVP